MTALLLTVLLSQTTPTKEAAAAIAEEVVQVAEENDVEGVKAEVAAGDLHPVAAAVKTSLERNGGRSDKPFTLVVRIESENAKAILTAFRECTPKTRAEEGNKAYQLHRSADEPDTFLLFERWTTLVALDAHLKADHTEKLLGVLDAEASIELQVMRPVAGGAKKRAKAADRKNAAGK